MGAWGELPFENDYALDWMTSVNDFLTQRIHDGLVNEDYFCKRGAAELLITSINKDLVMDHYNIKNIRLAIVELNIISDDTKWINTWSRPSSVEDDIKRQLGVLKGLLEDLEDSGFGDFDE